MSDPIELIGCTFTNEVEDLRAEITRLRALVESAHREAFADARDDEDEDCGASNGYWMRSAARAALSPTSEEG